MNAEQAKKIQKVSDHLEAIDEQNIIVICGDDETISESIDSDLRQAASADDADVGSVWFDALRVELEQVGLDGISYDIKTGFSDWHGGWYSGEGLVHARDIQHLGTLRDELNTALYECVQKAITATEEWLRREVKAIQEAAEQDLDYCIVSARPADLSADWDSDLAGHEPYSLAEGLEYIHEIRQDLNWKNTIFRLDCKGDRKIEGLELAAMLDEKVTT